jgi:hypothetical protein
MPGDALTSLTNAVVAFMQLESETAIFIKERNFKMIIAAAVKILKNDEECILMAKRHGKCFEQLHALDVKRPWTSIQGFMTNDFRFLDRVEAKVYAREHNQIINEEFADSNELYSEDLW